MNLERDLNVFIYVDNAPLPVYQQDGKSYIEVNLHAKSSYIISEDGDEGSQKYPVTPFHIKGYFDNPCNVPCYLRVCIDGQQLWMKPFPPQSQRNLVRVTGNKCGNEFRELLFTLPKLTSGNDDTTKLTDEGKRYLGTISFECLEAIPLGHFTAWHKQFKQYSVPGGLSCAPNLRQSLKQDFKSGGLSAREGRAVATMQNGTHAITMMRYKLGSGDFGKKIIHYRTREMLQDIGLHDTNWEKSKNKSKKKSKKGIDSQNSTQENGDNISDCLPSEITAFSINQVDREESGIKQEVAQTEENRNPLEERAIKQEAIDAQMCENVISRLTLKSLNLEDQGQKMYCFSPSVKLNKMCVDTPSQVAGNKFDFNSPSDMAKQFNMPKLQVKKELFDLDDVGEEGKDYRYIEIDEDIYMLEEVDDDVVWMGDDSCCFLDVPAEEVPLIDLCEEV